MCREKEIGLRIAFIQEPLSSSFYETYGITYPWSTMKTKFLLQSPVFLGLTYLSDSVLSVALL